jgi:hypothetical protein
MNSNSQSGNGHVGADTFDLAPVSLWLEDYSRLKALFDEWRTQGVTSLRDYLRADLQRIKTCSDCLRIVKVNRKTLALFEADSVEHLAGNMDLIMRDHVRRVYRRACPALGRQTDVRQQYGELFVARPPRRCPAQG